MPKIVRNEIEYSSTTSTANQVQYNNTTSGLSATNVQDAIDIASTASGTSFDGSGTWMHYLNVNSALVGLANILEFKTLTQSSYTTINNGGYLKIGNLIVFSAVITANSNVQVGQPLFSGMPSNPVDNTAVFLNENGIANSNDHARLYQGGVYPNSALTQGKQYHAFGVYTIA